MNHEDGSRGRLYETYVSTHTRNPRRSHEGFKNYPILEHLPCDRKLKILDVGCGAGELIEELTQAGWRDVIGVDISVEQVQLAQRLGRSGVEHGDLFEFLEAHRTAFDIVTATDVLEHFDRDEVVALLDSIYLSLTSGGVLVAQVPNATSPFFGNYAFGDFTHRSVFTASSAFQICHAAGFSEVDVFPVNPIVHGTISALRKMIWSTFAGAFKLALASETGKLRGHLVTQNLVLVARRA